MGVVTTETRRIEICANTNQYIDVQTTHNKCREETYTMQEGMTLIMHVNAKSTASFILHSSTLTTNAIGCQCANGKPTTPTTAGVHMGIDSASAGGLEICSSSIQYIDFTIPNNYARGRQLYNKSDSSFT